MPQKANAFAVKRGVGGKRRRTRLSAWKQVGKKGYVPAKKVLVFLFVLFCMSQSNRLADL